MQVAGSPSAEVLTRWTDPELMAKGRSRTVVRPYLANRAWYTRRSCAVVCGGGPRACTNRPRACTTPGSRDTAAQRS